MPLYEGPQLYRYVPADPLKQAFDAEHYNKEQ